MKNPVYILWLAFTPATIQGQSLDYVETFSYDPAARLTSVQYSHNAGIQYTYDLAGNLTQLVSEDGITLAENPLSIADGSSLTASPNPFYEATTFSYNFLYQPNLTLTIYTAVGERVLQKSIPPFGSGKQTIQWNGENEAGTKVQPGVYVCRLEGESISLSTRVVKLE